MKIFTNSWRVFIAFAALALFAGCRTSATNLNQLQVGMSKQEVVHILGTPQGVDFRDGTETLHYTLSEDRLAEGLYSGLMRPLKIGVSDYDVVLVKNKVTSFGKVPTR